MRSPFVEKEQGSIAFAAIAGALAISLGTFYVLHYTSLNQQAMRAAELGRARDYALTSNISNLGVIRSLLSQSKVPATALYEPAIFPKNYFLNAWDLEKNYKFGMTPAVSQKNKITVQYFEAKDTAIKDVTGILALQQRQTSYFTATQTLEIVSLNRDPAHRYYVSSVDIKANHGAGSGVGKGTSKAAQGDLITFGRINLDAPVPKSVQLKIKPASSGSFTSNFGSLAAPLPAEKYIIQVVGQGVVHHVDLDINGQKITVGVDANGIVQHKANNIHSDGEVGQTKAFLFGNSNEAVPHGPLTIVGCDIGFANAAMVDNNATVIKINATVFGVDGVIAKNAGLTQTVYASYVSPDGPGGSGEVACQKYCPEGTTAIYQTEDTFSVALDHAMKTSTGDDVFEGPKTRDINAKKGSGIICGNYRLTANDIKKTSGYFPSQLRRNSPTLFETVKSDSMVFKEYVAYMAPFCKREVVGLRNHCGCFAADTNIMMADGSTREASAIRAGDWLWNPKTNQAQRVARVIAGPEAIPMIELSVDNRVLLITQDHPFLTREGLRPAHTLREGDVIIDGENELSVQSVNSKSKSEGEKDPVVWNFELEGSHNEEDHYVVANGLMTGDLFLQIKLKNKK